MCFGKAWKLSDPIRNHLEKDLMARVRLNSTEVQIATGDISSPVTDKGRTNEAQKICAFLTTDAKFAEVWFTSPIYEGGEKMFSEPLYIEFDDGSGERKIKFLPSKEVRYLPVDVLRLLKEGDLLSWSIEMYDSKHQLRKLILVARANQLDYQNKVLGRFEKAVEHIGANDWEYAVR